MIGYHAFLMLIASYSGLMPISIILDYVILFVAFSQRSGKQNNPFEHLVTECSLP